MWQLEGKTHMPHSPTYLPTYLKHVEAESVQACLKFCGNLDNSHWSLSLKITDYTHGASQIKDIVIAFYYVQGLAIKLRSTRSHEFAMSYLRW